MSGSTDEDTDVLITYGGVEGGLSPRTLNEEIESIWSRKIASEQGRAAIAKALGVKADQIGNGPVPFVAREDESGYFGVELAVAAHWVAINVIVPALVGLATDELKARLVQLWQQVFKREIDGDGAREKLGEERTDAR